MSEVYLRTDNEISQKEKRAVKRFLFAQGCVVVILSTAAEFFYGKITAISVLIGGLIAWMPNIFLAIYMFTGINQKNARKTVVSSYVGELLKLLLIVFLMVIALRFFNIILLPFLIGLMGTYVVYSFALVWLKKI